MIGGDRSVEEAIRSRRWLLDALLWPFPNGSINVFDRDFRYLYAAGTGLDRVGLSPDQLIGRRLDDLFPLGIVDRVRLFYARAFAGEAVTFAYSVFGRQYTMHAWPLAEHDGTIRAIAVMAQEAPTLPSTEALSPRLRTVAALVAAGLTNQQIAERLHLRSTTVRKYIDRIMQRLGFQSRTQIGVWGVVRGLYRLGEDDHGENGD